MIRIKQLFRLVILAIILANCKTDKDFIIKGHIDGIEDGSLITLFHLDQQIDIDSTFSKNGKFILEGKVENPTICYIRCKNEYSIIIVENTEMSFKSPKNKMFLYSSIEGGKEQKLQNALNILQRPYLITTFSAYDSLTNNMFSNEYDKKRLIKNLNESQSIAQDLYINFAKKHPKSYLGLDIIYRNRKTIPKDTLKIIYENLPPSFKETSNSKALKIFLFEEIAQKGKHFIDFKAKTLKGEDFVLSSLKDNYIYLSFWSAGCAPCRIENRFLSQNFSEIPNELSIVSFSIDKNEKLWTEASKNDSIKWDNVSALEAEFGRVKNLYEVQGIPTSFLIDRDGIIIEQFMGYDKDQNLIIKLKTLIDQNKNKR
jgi:thiol-disulfide isomerase/thioredoxin